MAAAGRRGISVLLKCPLRVAIDCSLEGTMTDKELHRLVAQLKQCNSVFLNSGHAVGPSLHLTGLRGGARLHRVLETLWPTHASHPFIITEALHYEHFDPADLIYLSPDSQNNLQSVDMDKVYVLGGVVDLTINKRLTEYHASKASLKTAKLPVDEYMERTKSASLCFPINQVLGILLDVYNGSGWAEALDKYMPKRKGFIPKSHP